MYKIIFLITLFTLKGEANDCIPRDFGYGSVVCVCNSTYCDDPPESGRPQENKFYSYVSNKDGLRMQFSSGQLADSRKYNIQLKVYTNNTYQTIKGWGCAFTDSSGINMQTLSKGTQDAIMKQYFSKEGSAYSLARVPIGGTDFSTRPYTLDDTPGDVSLSKFSLQPEDLKYKIPYIQQAIEINPEIKIFASPWSAPAWMKTNCKLNGFGSLRDEYYQTYADYIKKFIDEYRKHNISMWAITTGNEPINGLNPFGKLNSMAWLPTKLGKWIAQNLGPTLHNSDSKDVEIMIMDDQIFELPWYPRLVLNNEDANKYVDGIAMHWYADDLFPASLLGKTYVDFPDKFLLMTEACTGSKLSDWPKVALGSWTRGERYILNIIEHITQGVSGWVDWNCVLNKEGSPNWIKNYVDSPIIVNPDKDEFYKQPMYYALKHVSQFVPPGSVNIQMTQTDEIKTMAFKVPSGEIVTVLYNRNESSKNISIHDATRDHYINMEMPALSIRTIIYSG